MQGKTCYGPGDEKHPSIIIEFEDGRYAQIHQCIGANYKLTLADMENRASEYPITSDFFALFIKALVDFFKTGKIPVEHNQTIDVIAVREAGFDALKKPFAWINL